MNYKIIAYHGGGIFSVFMDMIITNIYKLDDAENFYIEVLENEYHVPKNAFDYVFDQTCDETYKTVHCGFTGGFRKPGMGWGAIEDFKDLARIKECCKKFKIKREITDKIIYLPEKTLGVHFRGNDMNVRHPDYGIFHYADYLKKVNEIKQNYKIDNLFVASDNDDVIYKFSKRYTVFHYDCIRAATEKNPSFDIQMRFNNEKNFIQEAFLEMLTLARCDYLLCRVSNLANAAIAFADNIKIFRL